MAVESPIFQLVVIAAIIHYPRIKQLKQNADRLKPRLTVAMDGARRRFTLVQDLWDYLAMHISQSSLDSVVVEAEAGMVDSEQMECGCVQVVTVRSRLYGLETEFIGSTKTNATLYSTSGEPGSESACVVITPQSLAALRCGLAAKLGGTDDQRFIKHASLL